LVPTASRLAEEGAIALVRNGKTLTVFLPPALQFQDWHSPEFELRSVHMYSKSPHTASRLPLSLILIVLVLAVTARAQMGGIEPDPGSRGSGGRNTIEGRIYYPSGRNADRRFKIRLSGLRGEFFTSSDDTGAFSFRRVASGAYVVTVEAENEYQSYSEQVDVIDAVSGRGPSLGRTYNLQIRLNYKPTNNEKPGVIDAALLSAPKPAAELYQKALQFERAGDNEKAIEHLQRAIALHPRFTLALNHLGTIHHRLGKLDEAEKAFSAAVEIEPESYELRLNYGVVLLKNKHYTAAEAQFQQALKIKDKPLAHLFRGKTLIHMGRYADAENELQIVIKVGGDETAMAYRFLGASYIERGELRLAVGALEKYLSLAPTAKDAESVRSIIKQLNSQGKS
jgi:tetratricopeptide (TPR) repeat protein